MAGRRSNPLARVEFLGNENADWALFEVEDEYGCHERLWARKVRGVITFGRNYGDYEEGSDLTPPRNGERSFRIDALKRVISGVTPRTTRGQFQDFTRTSVTYRTDCGEERTVLLSVLRALIEDAEARRGLRKRAICTSMEFLCIKLKKPLLRFIARSSASSHRR